MNILQKRLGELDGAYWYVKIREMTRELKYAWNRALYGFDESDIYSLNYQFLHRTTKLLKQFRKKNIGLWLRDDFESMTKEEVNQILDEMISHFENSDPDERIMLETPLDMKQIVKVCDDASEHRRKALELFIKWFDDLWI